MFKAIINCLKQIRSYYSSWIGAAATAIGLATELTGKQWPLPPYAWWLIAIGATFYTAVQIQIELDAEKDRSRKVTPTIPLEKLVERIAGPANWDRPGAAQKTSDALMAIREKARLGALSVWGRKDANLSHLDFYPLEPIDNVFWSSAHIDYLEYLKTSTCLTDNATLPGVYPHYADLHFDAKEVEAVWPVKKEPKFKFRWPVVRT